MAQTVVVGSFKQRDRAEQAVQELESQGFSDQNVSIVGKDDRQNQEQGAGQMSNQNQNLSDGTTWGAGAGAAAGILASAGLLAIPGIGPLLAAGPIAATLGSTAVGGLAGSLIDMGIPEQEGRDIENRIRQGEYQCIVETEKPEQKSKAEQVLRHNGAENVKSFQR